MPTPSLPAIWMDDLTRLLATTAATGPRGEPVAQPEAFRAAEALILEVKRAGRKVMVLGNGGSAAIASHMQTDLAHSLKIRALIFTEPSTLTAQANDHGYETAFANLVDLWAETEDLVVAISSSGKSPNILNGCAAGKAHGARLLTFSGFRPDNPLRAMGDLNFYVASTAYGPVESAHAVLIHHLTDLILATVSSEVRS